MDPAGHILPMHDMPYGMHPDEINLPPAVIPPHQQHGLSMPPVRAAAPSALHRPYMEPRSQSAMAGRSPGRGPYPGMGAGPNMPAPHMEEHGPPGAPPGGRGGGRGGGPGVPRDRGKPTRREPSRRERQAFDTGAQMDLSLPELAGRVQLHLHISLAAVV